MKYEIRKIDSNEVVFKTDNLKVALSKLTSTSLKLIDTKAEAKQK